MKNTFTNFIYQSIFQVTKIVLPMITIPIVSNALGPEGIGVYNYTNSIAQYFVLIAGLGVGVYGNREIARVRDNKEKLSSTFWEIFNMSFIISLLSIVSYLVLVSFSSERVFFYLQSLVIVAAMFDISWFFMGIEDFKKTSLSSILAQVIAFFLIYKFVNGPEDLYLYIVIQGINLVFTQILMWVFIKNKIRIKKVSIKSVFWHFIPALQFFIPKIAIILYTNLSKTLLGWLDSNQSVGFYTNTLILNSILVTLVTTIDLVLLPKFSNLVYIGDTKNMLTFIKKSIHIQLYFTIPMMMGTILIVPHLVPWFFGDKFLFLIKTIPLVAPLTVIMPLGLAVGRQYLVPMNRLKVYNIAVLNGAIISIIINLSLIPTIGIYGAILAIVLAESFVSFTRVLSFVKETRFKFDYSYIFRCFICSFIMYISTKAITSNYGSSMVTTFLEILIGLAIYLLITSLLRCNPIITFFKEYKRKSV
ncbi:oligosaccharide flippase family protein [Enterococcus casseliflavus]|uniref:oligosaccharide flippase family protein n=1 Tax=Enterococcus casseliflavus TaxID=37734 RepID=UPI0032E40CA8